jgi:hypothetical protein
MALRVTEMSNGITEKLDASDETGMLRMLRQTDAQIFAGWFVSSLHPRRL